MRASSVPFFPSFCYNFLMLSGKHTHKFSAWLAASLSVMVPLTALATIDESDYNEAKTEYKELWHAAAETTKRRSQLEQSLAQFDSKVQNARQDLVKASDQRRALREQMEQHKVLINALRGQMDAAQQTNDFYAGIADSRKEDFTEFVRFLVSRDLAQRESGPAAGGDLLKRILRQSLGDAIEQQMAQDAILTARRKFFGQVDVLLVESDRVSGQLHASAQELSEELGLLEKQYGTISSIVDEKSKFIDDSWRIKKLTEVELEYVAKEAAESQGRIAGMQASLTKVNDELKGKKANGLREEMAVLSEKQEALGVERETVRLKDQAMQLIEDNALKAYQNAVQAKNTDTKLYRRVEELNLKRSNISDELASKLSLQSLSGSTVTQADLGALEAQVIFIDKTLALMKDGIPLEPAEEYVRADRQASEAKAERVRLSQNIADLSSKIATVSAEVSAKTGEIDAVEKQYLLSDLPPIFVWPVNGPVTAGYYDEDYLAVFHVAHRGMDIAIPQASPVRSISDGVVYAVKNGGLKGYSYVIVAHRNGYASLYGHVSAILVKQGDIVNAGQAIALSGGTPGTHGAGYMTTGAHVHLEVMRDGVHVNPLSVLPAR